MGAVVGGLFGLLFAFLSVGTWIGIALLASAIGLGYLFTTIPIDKLIPQYVFNVLTTPDLVALPLFVLMGEFLFRTKLSAALFSGLAPWAGLLPGRRHIVLTRDREWTRDGVEVVHSKDDALAAANGDAVSIIGGSDIFAMFHDVADRIELTEVLAEVEGDTFMDDPRDTGRWREIACEDHMPEGDRAGYRFTTLVRAD